jgi:hypothetical protein
MYLKFRNNQLQYLLATGFSVEKIKTKTRCAKRFAVNDLSKFERQIKYRTCHTKICKILHALHLRHITEIGVNYAFENLM